MPRLIKRLYTMSFTESAKQLRFYTRSSLLTFIDSFCTKTRHNATMRNYMQQRNILSTIFWGHNHQSSIRLKTKEIQLLKNKDKEKKKNFSFDSAKSHEVQFSQSTPEFCRCWSGLSMYVHWQVVIMAKIDKQVDTLVISKHNIHKLECWWSQPSTTAQHANEGQRQPHPPTKNYCSSISFNTI